MGKNRELWGPEEFGRGRIENGEKQGELWEKIEQCGEQRNCGREQNLGDHRHCG